MENLLFILFFYLIQEIIKYNLYRLENFNSFKSFKNQDFLEFKYAYIIILHLLALLILYEGIFHRKYFLKFTFTLNNNLITRFKKKVILIFRMFK